MSNRITVAAEKVVAAAAERGVELEELASQMAISFEEHFAYQTAQSHAHAMGRLTTEEAMTVYRALGELHTDGNGGWARGTHPAVKVAITMLMGQLLAESVGRRS